MLGDRYHKSWMAVRASFGMNGIFMHSEDLDEFANYLVKHQAQRALAPHPVCPRSRTAGHGCGGVCVHFSVFTASPGGWGGRRRGGRRTT